MTSNLELPSLTTIIHLTQSALSTYTAYYTYLTATKSMTYESRTKKAAKYSNTAEHHLWKTRKTLTGGALGLLASLATSISLVFEVDTATASPAILAATSFAIAVFLGLSYNHVSNYWSHSAKVPLPGMGDYNDAISTADEMRRCIGFLGVSWGAVGAVYLWRAVFGG